MRKSHLDIYLPGLLPMPVALHCWSPCQAVGIKGSCGYLWTPPHVYYWWHKFCWLRNAGLVVLLLLLYYILYNYYNNPHYFRILFHDAFQDPLGWAGEDSILATGDFSVSKLVACLSPVMQGPTTVVLDSLSWLLLHLPFPSVCQALQQLPRRANMAGERKRDASEGEGSCTWQGWPVAQR